MITAVSVARDCQMIPPSDQVMYLQAYPSDGHKSSYVEWSLEDCGMNVDQTEIYSSPKAVNIVVSFPSALMMADIED